MEFLENEIRPDRRKQKRQLVINILGAITLAFSFVSLFLILTLLLREEDDRLMQIGLVFSTFVFSLIGMMCGTIGFLKARILKKGGYYATTGSVLNLFGLIINAGEIIALMIFAFSGKFLV